MARDNLILFCFTYCTKLDIVNQFENIQIVKNLDVNSAF